MTRDYGTETGLILGAFGLGAGLVYFTNPRLGGYRQAVLRDKLTSLARQAGVALDKGMRDFTHRGYGTLAEARALFRRDEPGDEVTEARVRSLLGRHVSHPHAIRVMARRGRITLSGPILVAEVDDLLSAVWKTRGVDEIINQLDEHPAGDLAAFQSGSTPSGFRWDVMQETWAPATRWVMGTLGGILMGECARRRTPMWTALGTIGFGLFVRAVSNQSTGRWLGRARQWWARGEPAPGAGSRPMAISPDRRWEVQPQAPRPAPVPLV